jgi:hypothetical protein
MTRGPHLSALPRLLALIAPISLCQWVPPVGATPLTYAPSPADPRTKLVSSLLSSNLPLVRPTMHALTSRVSRPPPPTRPTPFEVAPHSLPYLTRTPTELPSSPHAVRTLEKTPSLSASVSSLFRSHCRVLAVFVASVSFASTTVTQDTPRFAPPPLLLSARSHQSSIALPQRRRRRPEPPPFKGPGVYPRGNQPPPP